jgi:hypothetical protein
MVFQTGSKQFFSFGKGLLMKPCKIHKKAPKKGREKETKGQGPKSRQAATQKRWAT